MNKTIKSKPGQVGQYARPGDRRTNVLPIDRRTDGHSLLSKCVGAHKKLIPIQLPIPNLESPTEFDNGFRFLVSSKKKIKQNVRERIFEFLRISKNTPICGRNSLLASMWMTVLTLQRKCCNVSKYTNEAFKYTDGAFKWMRVYNVVSRVD